MKKIWYIKIDSAVEGPYCVEEMKRDKRLTPDTLVWKRGFVGWKRIGDVEELRSLFKEEKEAREEKKLKKLPLDDEIVLDPSKDPPPLHLWLLIVLILLFSFFYNFYDKM